MSFGWVRNALRAIGRVCHSDGFHRWIGSSTATAQAGAVIFGVWYAINELSDREEEKRERQIERVLEYVQTRNQDSIQDVLWYVRSVEASEQRTQGVKFNTRVQPLWTFFDELMACVNAGLCDRQLAMDKFCPDVITYLRAARNVDVPRGGVSSKPIASDADILAVMGPSGLEEARKVRKIVFAMLSTFGTPVGDFYMVCRADNAKLDKWVFPEFERLWINEEFPNTPPELLERNGIESLGLGDRVTN